jgi:IS5 family transposase
MRFLGLQINDTAPDEKTIWYFREKLREKGKIESLFDRFYRFLTDKGVVAKSGNMVDASIVEAPKQRNSREENDRIKEGKTPEGWSENKIRQKDIDARWMRKGGVRHYGYKNHIKAEVKTTLIERYHVTDAAVHDSQAIEDLIDESDSRHEMYGDAAYSGEKIRGILKEKNIRTRIHEKGYRNRPLTEKQKERNKGKSRIRARIEHIFGFVHTTMKGSFIRTIGIHRARAIIGLMNLTYNLSRYVQLRRA